MCELLVFEGTLHRLRGCIDDFEASDVPRVEGEHGTSKAPGDRDLAQKARKCGADDYMGKPFEFPDLIRLVEKYAVESRKTH